jgi:uncharacterized membrane protein YdjX (TVP38/TMEM64 family)
MSAKKLLIPVFIIVMFIGLAGFSLVYHHKACLTCINYSLFSPETIRHFIQGFGPLAVVIYIFLYILNTFSPFFPPIFILSLSAGALFGPILGSIALTLGTLAGTAAAFFTARYLGRDKVARLVSERSKVADIYEKLGRNGFFLLLPMRLIGFPPYGIIDLICGLSKISYRDFFMATLIGSAPWIIIQVLLADRFTRFDPKDPVIWALFIAFILMIVITGKIAQRKGVA